MPHNEDGEFELILGNKQLLSVFFLVVVMLGVFFAMGYVVGRNSGPVGTVETASRKTNEAKSGPPLVVESTPGQTGGSRAPEVEAGNQSVPPAQDAKPSPIQRAAPAQVPPMVTPERTAPTPAPARPAATPVGDPAAGQSFLQVAAVKRSDAELLVEVLSKRGFPARVANGPDATLFRVLVGPMQDKAATSKTRADLEAAGFKSLLRNY